MTPKPKPQKKPPGSDDQNAEFEQSPDMAALDALTRKVLKAPKIDKTHPKRLNMEG
jgi:hypothetical protein